jgi:putative peptidoglycan lipid II flippase
MNLFKSFFTISAFTLLSRITGLLREILIARAFGAGVLTDAFNVAFRLPNLLRRLFAEGAFSQAFVPILAEYKSKQDKQNVKYLLDAVSICLSWVLVLTVLIGIIAAPILVKLIASGFHADAHTYQTTVDLTRIMFPYIGFMSMVAFSSAILNSYNKFSIPAFTPVLLNVSFIVFAMVFSGDIYMQGVAVFIGGLLQLAIQVPALHKLGMLPRLSISYAQFKKAVKFDGVKRIAKQMVPATLAVSVAQISLIINTNIASSLKAGSVSWLSYADRLMEFPTALLGVALSTILMSNLSKSIASKDYKQYSATLDWGLQFMLILTIPCAIGLFLYGEALCATLFNYGKFNAHDVEMTSKALTFYGIGIIGLIAVKILAPGFYAQQNIKTPVRIAIIVLVLTQIMNILFVPSLSHTGLALSIGLGACINAILLLIGLIKSKAYTSQFHIKNWLIFIIKIAIATSIIGMIMYYINSSVNWVEMHKTPVLRIVYLLGSIAIMGIVYFLSLYIMKLDIRKWLRK